MPLVPKDPFSRQHLKKKADTFTVRLNQQERAMLEEIKEDLNINSDSKALKFAAWIGKNVLHTVFSRKILRFLFDKDRNKLSDFKNF